MSRLCQCMTVYELCRCVRVASVVCEEDLITFGSTTPAPATESTTPASLPPSSRLLAVEATSTTAGPSTQQEGRQCTPVQVTAAPTDAPFPDAAPVEPTNYISEYVRLRVGKCRNLWASVRVERSGRR